ncbi:GNAT family N-acetyltransferase [Enorma massiliensis]
MRGDRQLAQAASQACGVFEYGAHVRPAPGRWHDFRILHVERPPVARTSDLIGGVRRNAPDPIPCTLLGQLAVDARFQGKSTGARLLQDAIKRTARASMVVASRALIVDLGDEHAEGFCQHFGFRRLSGGSRRMFLPL